MKFFLRILACFTAAASAAPLTLRFDEPATDWEKHGLPLGNGTIGAVAMGDPAHDRIQITVDSLWTGDENPSGGYDEAGKQRGQGCFGAFQSMGDLTFTATSSGKVSDFHRALDLQQALHTTSWKSGITTHTREIFVSFPDKVLAWHLTAKDGTLDGLLELKGHHSDQLKWEGNDLRLTGEPANGLKYEARVRVFIHKGKQQKEGDGIRLSGGEQALVLMAADTNYVMGSDAG
ncbi:hypothetical protein HNR46_004182 [Haloferula luteola]|uniref:Glycosyl hydrolase family 95 N-terminal domain-containing protein n=2 Tax=Haloferula luteola TaxID=595692 RepID=A0A840V6M8_9BACT|nr:hypothetical protein [Haloferula luteola]